jgi:hypothetical protein
MNKCHRISWEGRDVGSTAGDGLLPLSVASIFMFITQKKIHLYRLI